MTGPNPSDPPDPDSVRCPTCRASQAWSDTCRRCKSDLRLLRAFADSYHSGRRACLRLVLEGDARGARDAAARCHALAPSGESRRLLAVAALLEGDWAAAEQAGRAT